MRRTLALLGSIGMVALSSGSPAHAHSGSSTAAPDVPNDLVPYGAVGLRLRRYGLNASKVERLIRTRDVRAQATIRTITSRLDHLLPGSNSATSCPASYGTKIVATFRYRHRTSVRATVQTSGCEFAFRGKQVRRAALPPGPGLIRRLEALTK